MQLFRLLAVLTLLLIPSCSKPIGNNRSLTNSSEGITQLVQFSHNVYSGSKPSAKDMQQLLALNVRTIVCVDGVPPEANAAARHGIESIHIPMQYSIPDQKTIDTLIAAVHYGLSRGSVYLHCHYGKHRSAAAAAIALIGLGIESTEEMLTCMAESETSPLYKGLFLAVTNQTAVTAIPTIETFESRVLPVGMKQTMIAMDRAFDRLAITAAHDWEIPTQFPDMAPSADAGYIAETLRSIQLSNEANQFSGDFETLLINAMHQASGLEAALIEQKSTKRLNAFLKQVEQSCINCHTAFRK